MKTLIFIALLMTCMFFGACKKNHDQQNKCGVTDIADTRRANSEIRITYDGNGKISQARSHDLIVTYTYSGNTTTILYMDSATGNFRQKKILTINSQGLITNIKTESDPQGTAWDNYVFEYDGAELIKATQTYSSGGTPNITNYFWSNGNMTFAGPVNCTYYSDLPAQEGDYFSINSFLQYGVFNLFKISNLVKSIGIFRCTYTFRPDGKIESVTVVDSSTGATTSHFVYEYPCN
jgi:hypothetical protein